MINFLLSAFFASMLSFLAVYVAITILLHLQTYVSGIVNFGVVGFWGLGMYLTGIFNIAFGIPFFLALPLAALCVGVIAVPLGRVLLNLDGQAVLVGTLAFASIASDFVYARRDLTGGSMGIGMVQIPIGTGEHRVTYYALFIVALVVLLILYAHFVKKAPFGRLLFSIRDNEPLSRSLGKPTFRKKIIFFGVTCGLLALFGGLTAPLYGFLLPYFIQASVTFMAWIALTLGGKAKISGAVLGVLATVFLFDYVIFIMLPLPANFAQMVPFFKFMIYGLTLVLVLMFRPTGILGTGKLISRKKKEADK